MIKKSKGFTMIEVLTVVAILGIIVLLAAPRFLSYIEVAKLAQIKNDVKAHENHIESKLAMHSDFVDDWDFISNQELEELRASTKLYDRTGLIEGADNVIFTQDNKIIPKKTINTKLKGIFIFDSNGKVYYYDGKVEAVERLACEDAELEGYICIYTIEDLRRISNNMSAKYILMNDLDLSSIENWQPIGHETGEILTFTGEFNGNNYSINNLKINESEWNLYNYALFNSVENSVFKDITMKNPSIILEGERSANFIAPLVGWSLGNDTFENISIENFNMSGDNIASFVGSVVGRTEGADFEKISLNNSVIFGGNFVGGVAGMSRNSYYKDIFILNSKINSIYKGDYGNSFLGGVIGDSENSIVNNVKILNSDIKGYGFVGGIIGLGRAGTHDMKNVTIKGKVEGESSFVGGIIGDVGEEFNIDNVKIDTHILARDFVGGIAGRLEISSEDLKSSSINNIVVNASIKINPIAESDGYEMFASGGIVGSVNIKNDSELTVKNVRSSGEIHARHFSGGIFGVLADSRGGWEQPVPTQNTIHFDNVSSNINFIETFQDPNNKNVAEYLFMGGIVGTMPQEGTVKLNLKNVYYDGNMGLSELYKPTAEKPIIAYKIAPIVSLDGSYLEDYVDKWNSIVEIDNVYWIKDNSPRLEQFDYFNLGR